MAKASLEDLYSDSEKPASSQVETKASPEPDPVVEETPEETPVEAKTEEPAEREPAEATGKGDKSPAVTKAGKKDVPPTSEEEEGEIPLDVQGLKSAVRAERDKRNDWKSKAVKYETELEAERREKAAAKKELDELRAQLQRNQQPQPSQATPQQQQQPQQRQRPDAYTDPEGAAAFDRELLLAEVRRVEDQMRLDTYRRSAEISRRLVSQQHQDYEQAEAVFAEAARQDQTLLKTLMEHPSPAEYAYHVGKELLLAKEIREAGSIEAWAQKKAEEKFAEVQRSQAAQPVTQQAASRVQPRAQPAPPPQSLAGVTSMAPRNRQPNTGPTPLADLYKS